MDTIIGIGTYLFGAAIEPATFKSRTSCTLILPFKPSHFLQNFDRFTVNHALQNTQNNCHQWFSDSSKLHQIRFRPGLRPGPHWGSLQCSTGLRGPTSKEGKGKGKVRERRKRKGKGCANELSHFSKCSDPSGYNKKINIVIKCTTTITTTTD